MAVFPAELLITRRPKLAFKAKRVELAVTIAELHRLQIASTKGAAFDGWTPQAEAAYEVRIARRRSSSRSWSKE